MNDNPKLLWRQFNDQYDNSVYPTDSLFKDRIGVAFKLYTALLSSNDPGNLTDIAETAFHAADVFISEAKKQIIRNS